MEREGCRAAGRTCAYRLKNVMTQECTGPRWGLQRLLFLLFSCSTFCACLTNLLVNFFHRHIGGAICDSLLAGFFY